MYNEELKGKFISECATTDSTFKRARYLFNGSERFEKMYGKDLCAISQENIGEVVESIVGARLGTQTVDLSMLRKYARWCIENGVDGACNALLEERSVDVQKLRDTMVDSPKTLQDLFDHAFPPEVDGKADNLCRGYFWMAFMGLEEKDSLQVTSDHVDLRNMVIRFDEKEYTIYRESIPTLRHLCIANSFFYDYTSREAIVQRVSGNKILRGTGSSPDPNPDSIRRATNRKLSSAVVDRKISFKYSSLRLSGILYRMYQEEISNGECDIRKWLLEYDQDVNKLEGRRINRREEEFRTDYERWKIAFNK